MAISGSWNKFVNIPFSLNEWITIEISQVDHPTLMNKVRETSLYALTLHMSQQKHFGPKNIEV